MFFENIKCPLRTSRQQDINIQGELWSLEPLEGAQEHQYLWNIDGHFIQSINGSEYWCALNQIKLD